MTEQARTYLEFERSIADLEKKIFALEQIKSDDHTVDVSDEIQKLKQKAQNELKRLYSKLGAWEKTQIARHPARPHFSGFRDHLIKEFVALEGDRSFGEDEAIIGGLGFLDQHSVMVIGHEKGKDTKSRLKHNFGMARPEGYRKSVRLMNLAEQFKIPVITFVDTAGAYPGRGAEERGQAEAIAKSIEKCLTLNVPIISVIIGEGGSGGAVALAAADKVLMLEHSIYSVISPEGCASILWRDPSKAKDAANAMKITAQDLKQYAIIDNIIQEPVGGAHRNAQETIKTVGKNLSRLLSELLSEEIGALKEKRYNKFLEIGRL